MSQVIEDFCKLKQKEKLALLKRWDIEYYEQDNPSISDEEYDACVREYNQQYKNKYESALGSASSNFKKYKHPYPVLSLDKETNIDNMLKRIADFDNNVVIQPKLDGLTIVYYPDGSLVSRGNGYEGEVLPHANTLNNLPKPLDFPVRMEAVIEKEDYEKHFKDSTKNARNVAAGILRRKDKSVDLQYVKYYAYNILGVENMTETKQIMALKQAGFTTPSTLVFGKDNSKDTTAFCKENLLKRFAENQPYYIDGIVVKANCSKQDKDYGMTAHHPNNAFAFKFVSKTAESILREIDWSEGRNKLTPVAIFDPVELNGSTITRASLHNLNIIRKLDLKIGSKVIVTLKNEIIPQIISSSGEGEEITPPSKCPSCGSLLKINESNELICENPSCQMALASAIEKLVSKDGLDIQGISDKTINKLLETNNLTNQFELLVDPRKKLQNAGVGDNVSLLLSTRLENKKQNVNPANFLYACSIPLIGINTAKIIFEKFKTVDNFLSKWKDEGLAVNGIGEAGYASIKDNLEYIRQCARYISSFKEIQASEKSKGTIVITGSLSQTKKHYKNLIEKAGYGYSDSLNASTVYLVAEDKNGNSSKLKKARQKNIPIINEDDLLNILT